MTQYTSQSVIDIEEVAYPDSLINVEGVTHPIKVKTNDLINHLSTVYLESSEDFERQNSRQQLILIMELLNELIEHSETTSILKEQASISLTIIKTLKPPIHKNFARKTKSFSSL